MVADRRVELGPGLHLADHVLGAAVTLDGGVCYGVNKDSKNIDLALDAVKILSSPAVLTHLVVDTGSVPANTLVDTSGIDSPGLKQIMGWLATRAVPTTHANSSAAELDEWSVPLTMELDADPEVALFQMCAASPLGPHDRQRLLCAGDPGQRAEQLVSLLDDLVSDMRSRLAGA